MVVVARHVPADCEAQAADLARLATVSQLRRSLSTYNFHPEQPGDPEQPKADPCGVSGWYDANGRWRLRACLEPDQGAVVAAALAEARDALFQAGDPHVTGPDALVEMAQRSLDAVPGASRRDTYRVMVHVDTDGAHLHDGPALPDAWRRLILCDTTGVIVGVRDGRPIDVGRRRHIVPVALRRTIERRDRGCRVPGCAGRRIQIHHIVHWEHGGPTDAHNLVGLCPKHHRMHHQGLLGIAGNPNRPDGLTFTDRWGHPLRTPPPPPLNGDGAVPLPAPPGTWRHPLGERLYTRWLTFVPSLQPAAHEPTTGNVPDPAHEPAQPRAG